MPESRKSRFWFGPAIIACAISYGQASIAQEHQHLIAEAAGSYHVSIGDVLEISVYKHPEFSRRAVVLDDGKLQTPWESGASASGRSTVDGLLRDIKVVDVSVTDVAGLVRNKLQSMIANPHVTVTVVQRASPPLPRSASPQPRDTPSPQHPRECCIARDNRSP